MFDLAVGISLVCCQFLGLMLNYRIKLVYFLTAYKYFTKLKMTQSSGWNL